MEYIAWCKLFSVKNPHIDNQHKQLFRIVNEYHQAVKERQNKDYIFSILNRLIQYTEAHFKDEERIMKASGCPKNDVEKHIAEHSRLIEEIFQLNSDLQNGKKQTLAELEHFFDTWLIRHVLETDKRYLRYLLSGNSTERKVLL